MNAIFVHDHIFIKDIDNVLYSKGSFSYDVFRRYLKFFNNLTIVSRMRDIGKDEVNSYSLASGDRVSFVPIPNFGAADLIRGFRSHHSIIRHEVKRADRVIIRLPSIAGLIAANESVKERKPYLIEMVGCPWDAYWNHGIAGKAMSSLMWMATKKAVENAPYVIYVTREFLQKRYPTKGMSLACSDVALQSLDDSILARRLDRILGMSPKDPVVLATTAAVDVRYKGQANVIKAISKLNKNGFNYEYYLVGGGNSAFLRSVAEKCGVAHKVFFVGTLPHDKVFDFLDNIDIYLQPSDAEGVPRAMIEAMSRGCPCIGSSAGGIPELIDQEFIFRKGDFNELVRILWGISKEKMLMQARRNFECAREYERSLLDKRRESFLSMFYKGGRYDQN